MRTRARKGRSARNNCHYRLTGGDPQLQRDVNNSNLNVGGLSLMSNFMTLGMTSRAWAGEEEMKKKTGLFRVKERRGK